MAIIEQESVTIAIPTDLLEQVRRLRGEQESFEEMVIGAIAKEVRRRRGLAAHERIVARSAAVEAVSGVQSSSVELIRQLREGEV